MVWAIWLIGVFYLFTLVLGYGAAALLPRRRRSRAANQNNAAPLLAYDARRRAAAAALVSAVAFATILAVVAGLTITASASFAHDVYANVIKQRRRRRRGRRCGSPGSRRSSSAWSRSRGGIVANGQNVAFLVALAFAVAASANLPTILYSLFWKRFNTTGALCSIYGGLVDQRRADRVLAGGVGQAGQPGDGRSASMLQGVDFHWFPLDNPGMVSIPLSFLLGVVGTLVGRRPDDERAGARTPRWRSGR